VAPMVAVGAGVALALPALTKSVVGSVALGDIGKASGAFSTMRQLGGAFGVAVPAAVFAAAGSYGSAAAFSDGFTAAIAVTAVLGLAGTMAGLALPPRLAGRQAVDRGDLGVGQREAHQVEVGGDPLRSL
jgi:hypothetical protein